MALSRRTLLELLGTAGAAFALAGNARASGSAAAQPPTLPPYTGPDPNPYWGSVGPYVSHPQKSPLIQLTDRPVQLETPRHFFLDAITPNHAFFVRWHLDPHPTAVDLGTWRLRLEGAVERPLSLSFDDLLKREAVTLVAVNQCSGNSRSRFSPRVPGGQWGNGAMGCARWTGVRVRDLLDAAGVRPEGLQLQAEGMERGRGPEGKGSHAYLKSLPLDRLDEAIVAYAMNDEPLPLLNGFPARLVVPGYFSTYWVKALGALRVLDAPDENFWMKPAYLIPDTPGGHVEPDQAGSVAKVPIGRMPVRSFVITPDGGAMVPAGLPVLVRGIAFSGHAGITRVEVSDGSGWTEATLGEALGPYAFRTWSWRWTPTQPGTSTLSVRATDAAGNTQGEAPIWNPSGYAWNRIETQAVAVGRSA